MTERIPHTHKAQAYAARGRAEWDGYYLTILPFEKPRPFKLFPASPEHITKQWELRATEQDAVNAERAVSYQTRFKILERRT